MNRVSIKFCGLLVSTAIVLCCHGVARGDEIAIVVDAAVEPPVRLALDDLQQALKARGHEPSRRATLDNATSAIVVGVAQASPQVDRLLSTQRIELPEPAESLCVRRLMLGQQNILLLAGRDTRGLSYALLEAARAIELAPRGGDPL